MENLIKIIQTFLEYSDEKLEELSEKNKALKMMPKYHADQNKGEGRK